MFLLGAHNFNLIDPFGTNRISDMTKQKNEDRSKNMFQKILAKMHKKRKSETQLPERVGYETNVLEKCCSSRTDTKPSRRCSKLMLLCKMNPQLSDVSKLLNENPFVIFEADSEGRLPLHVACQYGACPGVIKELLEANKDAAIVKDISGMLPIHKVCCLYKQYASQNKPEDMAEQDVKQVLQLLLRSVPRSILVEDYDGTCPVSYAIHSDLSKPMIHALRRQSELEKMRESIRENSFGI